MNADIQFQEIGPLQRDLLIAMYDRFDPLGAALGLPPYKLDARLRWIGNALCQIVNVAAFSRAGEVIGHSFLASDSPGSAEVAVFVHHGFRRRGIGASLLREVLALGRAARLQRVCAVTAPDNRAALRLLVSCGFRLTQSDLDGAELDIDLHRPPEAIYTDRRKRGS